jgi:hypothetical protein
LSNHHDQRSTDKAECGCECSASARPLSCLGALHILWQLQGLARDTLARMGSPFGGGCHLRYPITTRASSAAVVVLPPVEVREIKRAPPGGFRFNAR